MNAIRPWVFFPPLLFLLLTVAFSFLDEASFLRIGNEANSWILVHFGWLFSWGTLGFLVLLGVVYLSPLGKVTIGGKGTPTMLSRWNWFAITLCTTIATGILFWGPAEPLHHLHNPPAGLGLEPASDEAAVFSMSTLLMHWTLTPYAIYTIAALVFSLAYYNLKQPFSLGAMLFPLGGKHARGWLAKLVDVICLYGLVAGMAASLGTGLLSITGGLDRVFNTGQPGWLLAVVAVAIVLTFVLSSASGLMKGIRWLSQLNTWGFMILALFVLLAGPTRNILQLGGAGFVDYAQHFFPRSAGLDTGLDQAWQGSWTVFYWANWLAWAPISAIFLGQLARGYSVRDFIHFNLLLPSLFGGLWMVIFGGASIELDRAGGHQLHASMQAGGEESVIYIIMDQLPGSQLISFLFLLMVFLSFVTAADSNTSAMSGISTKGISPTSPEAPLAIKVAWGLLIGLVAYVMVSSAGVEGIRLISVLGGFPSLFLLLAVAAGLVKLMIMARKGQL